MRTAAALLAATGLLIGLAACSTTPAGTDDLDDTASSACVATKAGSASDGIDVSGEFAAKPTVKIDGPLAPKSTERTVVIEGDGDVAADGTQVLVDYTLYNATTGDPLWNARVGGTVTNGPITYELDGLQYVVAGAGSRLVAFVLNQ